MKKINFPHDPFSTINKKIIKPEDFWKSFKKQYSEDYVGLNFINLGFEVFKPFQDVGTDRILIKHLCENCNFINEDSINKKCDCQNKEKITRFIQIKTREVSKENSSNFGYTLRSKDFVPDPRIIFLFFSDYTNDFLIFQINDLIEIVSKLDALEVHYKNPTFRFDNNRVHSIKYNFDKKKWIYASGKGKKKKEILLDNYVNLKGVSRMCSTKIEKDFDKKVLEITNFRKNNFFEMAKGKTFKENEIELVNLNIKNFKNQTVKEKKDNKKKILKSFESLTDDIKASIKKYEKKEIYEKN